LPAAKPLNQKRESGKHPVFLNLQPQIFRTVLTRAHNLGKTNKEDNITCRLPLFFLNLRGSINCDVAPSVPVRPAFQSHVRMRPFCLKDSPQADFSRGLPLRRPKMRQLMGCRRLPRVSPAPFIQPYAVFSYALLYNIACKKSTPKNFFSKPIGALKYLNFIARLHVRRRPPGLECQTVE